MWCGLGRASTRSSIDGLARPVRTVAKLRFVLSMLFSMRDICRAHARVPGKGLCLVRPGQGAEGVQSVLLSRGAQHPPLCQRPHPPPLPADASGTSCSGPCPPADATLYSAVCKMRSFACRLPQPVERVQVDCIPGCSVPSIVSRSRWPAAVLRCGPRRQCPDVPVWRANGQRSETHEQHWSRHRRCCG